MSHAIRLYARLQNAHKKYIQIYLDVPFGTSDNDCYMNLDNNQNHMHTFQCCIDAPAGDTIRCSTQGCGQAG